MPTHRTQVGRARVTVVGSLNLDYIASVEKLPAPGETVPATRLVRRFGGKGANQAVAAARQGAQVSLVGCVGEDDEGRAYRERLRQESINTAGLVNTRRAVTGTALIAVEKSAENLIIVAPEANGELSPARLRAARKLIAAAEIVLLQLEIPMATVIETIRLANRAQVPVVLNPSPLREGFPWGQVDLETLIVNVGEAQAVFQLSPERMARNLAVWRRGLAQRRISQLIITRGAQSTLCLTVTDYFEVLALQVKPVDTVGAGDAFAGAFVARRAEGMDLRSAIGYANCAGALATLKAGAQESIPDRAVTTRTMRRLLPGR